MKKNKIILLVEDNPDDEQLTRRALQKNHIGLYWLRLHEGPYRTGGAR